MAKFLSRDEQTEFIKDSNVVFSELIKKLPLEIQNEAVEYVNKHYNKWNYILVNLPSENKKIEPLYPGQYLMQLYIELRLSVVLTKESDQHIEYSELRSIDDCISRIGSLKIIEEHRRSLTRLVQYDIGAVIFKIREDFTTSTKSFLEIVNTRIGYKKTYAFWLIKFYKACNKYKKLRFTSMSTTKLMKHFTDLLKHMKSDKEFWNEEITIT